MNTDRQEGNRKIAEALAKVEAALEEATKIADEYNIEFSWDGPSYGMGGTYVPNRPDDWCESSDWEASDEGSWIASSQQC